MNAPFLQDYILLRPASSFWPFVMCAIWACSDGAAETNRDAAQVLDDAGRRDAAAIDARAPDGRTPNADPRHDGSVTDSSVSDAGLELTDAGMELDASDAMAQDAGANIACRDEWFKSDAGLLTLCPGAGDAGCPPISTLAGYKWVEGDVELLAERNEDLEPLSCLEWSNRLILMYGSEITSLAALSHLGASSGLVLNRTQKLMSLAGLGSLTTLGYLELQNNLALTGVEGLGQSIEIGSIHVFNNPALRSLAGLQSANAVVKESVYVWGNSMLPQCETERLVAPYPAALKQVEGNLGAPCP